MPSNPMQRKVRNSFLIGMIVMLLVALLIGALLFMVAVKPMLDDKKAEEGITYATVYQLKGSVKSGNEISNTMLQKVTLPVTSLPSDKKIAEQYDERTQKTIDIGLGDARIAKIDLEAGTILSDSVLTKLETVDKSLRLVEYNMVTLPTMLDIGETIDIRIAFASGQDLAVLVNKVVKDINGNVITLELTEEEIIMMNSAIVEAYIMPSANLYAAKYSTEVVPEDHGVITATYIPTPEASYLLVYSPNILKEAKEDFNSRYSDEKNKQIRNNINGQLQEYNDERTINVEAGIQKQIEAAKAAREEYLSGMSGY
jgi:hypothetical protein